MIVYHDNLEKLFDARVPAYESIKSLEFGKDNKVFYVGTDKAKIYSFSLLDKQ